MIHALSFIGDWLHDSGWTTALSNSGVTTSGNESLLSGHNVTKYVHHVVSANAAGVPES